MELVRAICLSISDTQSECLEHHELIVALKRYPEVQWEDEDLTPHIKTMEEGKLVTAKFLQYFGEEEMFANLRLTWKGHEFAEDCRDPSTWEKVKQQIPDGASFSVISQILIRLLTS